MSNLATLSYPRTGKRGVPQQFPRRLYEMLESEARLAATKPNETFVISWSESGRAFRIANVEEFASTVLPRYFRTKKFSSFQRNLNLYGFAKVRRGPDTDMYAHPSFIRSRPEMLSQLRKSTTASRRRLSKSSSEDSDSSSSSESPTFRPVSPSPSREPDSPPYFQRVAAVPAPNHRFNQTWLTFNKQPLAPIQRREGTGRLDLLALAIEREGCFAN